MNGRVEDANIGRFISADPVIPDPLNTQAFNRYSYVLNNPLKYTDPSGYVFVCRPVRIPGGGLVGAPKPTVSIITLDAAGNETDSQTANASGGGSGDGIQDGVSLPTVTISADSQGAPPNLPGLDCDEEGALDPDLFELLNQIPAPNINIQASPPPCISGLTAVSPNSAPTPISDAQGNQVMGVDPNGTTSPMYGPTGRPPVFYAAAGEASGVTGATRLVGLSTFWPGMPLDAQRDGGLYSFGATYNGSVSYANYSFGIFAAAAGLSLAETLAGADFVASFAHYNSAFQRDTTGRYPHLLDSNVRNITNGYNAYKNGGVCQR